ncbi:MAG: nucleotidyltransferase family protein, partial [Lachnospiraceae bacterium]|nr:nucleotidyltransferase family protein [Lachnospiraceae bacterium]
MKTIGIIAEYNPFHNGHRYQIEEVKKRTGAENIVIAMSGDFVQRGTPAFTDKYLRAQMALLNGADFVFEIPVTFACASAEYFALAGVSLLSSLGFVDGICFGAEYE